MDTQKQRPISRFVRWMVALLVILITYVMSSGPVLGLAFWLREATGWDAFYVVMLFYYPVLAPGHGGPIDAYIEWWVVDVFRTVGPG